MKLGAPLTMHTTFEEAGILMPPAPSNELDASCMVSIIFKALENGISSFRGWASATASVLCPSLPPATTIGASDEFPSGVHFIVPVASSFSSDTLQLLHIIP